VTTSDFIMTRRHRIVTTGRAALVSVANMRIIIAIVAVASIANASPRYSRPHVAVPDAKPIAATKPPPATTAPAITADQAMTVEELVDPIRRDQEALLEGLVRDTPDDDAQKPDLIFRLAELYALQARLWRISAMDRSLKP
jgi:hypothetical protein